MTALLPELGDVLPADVQLDGELVALDSNGHPDFHRLGRRMLHGDTSIPVTLMVFDVLAVEGMATTALPYSERRALLELLEVDGPMPGSSQFLRTVRTVIANNSSLRAASSLKTR